jgi:hypothetical protein
LLLVGLYWGYADRDVWSHLEPSRELHKPAYSEAVYPESIFRTRANTWSNLAFVLVGIYAITAAAFDRRRGIAWLAETQASPILLTALFGTACVYLGIGSGIFHASLTRWGQQLDVASMYPPIQALIALLLHRMLVQRCAPTRPGAAAGLSIALTAILILAGIALYHYKWSMSSKTVLPLHILALAVAYTVDVLVTPGHGRLRWLALAFLALLLGVACRQLDVAGAFSGPHAWYQGHALWHGLCSLSLAMGWCYIRDTQAGPEPLSRSQDPRSVPEHP